jgi:hypothetical protein
VLRSDRFCIGPQIFAGRSAMMYSARDSMYLDTKDIEEDAVPLFWRPSNLPYVRMRQKAKSFRLLRRKANI